MRAIAVILWSLVLAIPASADVTTTFLWDPNTESDLAGYKVYERLDGQAYGAPRATLGLTQTYPITLQSGPTDERHFFVVTAFDKGGLESGYSNEQSILVAQAPPPPPAAPVIPKPVLTPTLVDAGLRVTVVPVSIGVPLQLDLRYAKSPMDWGSAPSAACPSMPCTFTDLEPGEYQLRAVYYTGEANVDAVFGPIGDVVTVKIPIPVVVVPPVVPPAEIFTNVTNENGVLSFEYDQAICAKSPYVSKSTAAIKGSKTRKTVILKCVKP